MMASLFAAVAVESLAAKTVWVVERGRNFVLQKWIIDPGNHYVYPWW